MTKEERKVKRIRVQFDVTLSVKSQKPMQQFKYLIYGGSYLTFYSISFCKRKSITAKHSFMTLSTLRRTHLRLVRILHASCNTRHSEPNMGCKEWMQACLTLSQKPSPHSLEFWKSLFIPSVSLRDEKAKTPLISSQKLRTLQKFFIVASDRHRQKSGFWRGELLVSFNLLWST